MRLHLINYGIFASRDADVARTLFRSFFLVRRGRGYLFDVEKEKKRAR